MHHDPRKNVLWVARSLEALGASRDVIERARAALKTARDRRKAPFVDRSLYVSWNAMMCDAFLEAGAILGRDDCTRYALTTLELLWNEAFVPGSGMVHRVPDPGPRPPDPGHWLLDDQAQAAAAFLTAYEHTGEGRWLDRARELTELMLAFYWDQDGGGFFDTREATRGFLGERGKPIQDAPTSSPNAVAALVLLRLGVVSGESRYAERAGQLLAAFAGRASELSIHGATYLRAVDWFIQGECKVVVADTTTSEMAELARAFYRPRKIVVSKAESPGTLVCAGSACAAPAFDAAALRATLETFGRSG
jgi:uncharacterized protein YyaL (SSP411 family)